MTYEQTLDILSQCGLGALVLDGAGLITYANETADHLLHGKGQLTGLRLQDMAPALCEEPQAGAPPVYTHLVFGEYLLRCPTPDLAGALPEGTQLVVFRDATNDACHDMLLHALNHVSDAVVLCDDETRIWWLNDAAVQLDSLVIQDVRGETVDEVYDMLDGSKAAVPRVIQEKRPLTNLRQYYGTRYGKRINVVSAAYPILQNGQLLGGYSVLRDYSAIDTLNKKIIDLQSELLERTTIGGSSTKSALLAKYTFSDIIRISPVMNDVVNQCLQVAKSDSSVMIYGETGTGKELFAQSIHNASRRAKGPFLAINCAAIPENLLESLLFGTEKGAYTGAEKRVGLFEQASGGTLLLDEINSMNIGLQSKLLRVLQEGVVRHVGGSAEIRVDVRVLSNTNIPPYQAIAEDKLRRDLFYRLGVVNINVPPLRERREDIPVLAKHFIMECNKKLVRTVSDIDEATLEVFQTYDWPGNVRELQHAIEHAMNVLPYHLTVISPQYLPDHIYGGGPVAPSTSAHPSGGSFHTSVQSFERGALCQVLREHGGNITKAARALQMSRQNLQYYIKRHQIDIAALASKRDN